MLPGGFLGLGVLETTWAKGAGSSFFFPPSVEPREVGGCGVCEGYGECGAGRRVKRRQENQLDPLSALFSPGAFLVIFFLSKNGDIFF